MNSVVLLLGILSLTFILSRMSLLRQIQGLLVVPAVIATGYLFSPHGLFSLGEAIISPFEVGIRVLLTWQGFLVGMRLLAKDPNYSWRKEGTKKLLYISLSTLLIYTFFNSVFRDIYELSMVSTLGVSLCLASFFIASSYFSQKNLELDESLSFLSYADNIFLSTSVFLAVMLFLPSPDRWIFLGLHFFIALIVGAVVLFLIGKKREIGTPDRLALGGVVVLASGWTLGVSGLEIFTGLLLGSAVSALKILPRFDSRLIATEVPLRLVLYFYAGLVLTLSWDAVYIALPLTFLRFLAKWWLVRRKAHGYERLNSVYRLSGLSVPLFLSLTLAHDSIPMADLLLSIVCISYLINDVLLLIERTLFKSQVSATQGGAIS